MKANSSVRGRSCRRVLGGVTCVAMLSSAAALLSGPLSESVRGSEVKGTTAERLVAEALRAETAGELARRNALLDEALQLAPDYALARWHRGEIQVDGTWRNVDEAQRAAASDPRRSEYNRLRESNGESLAAQLALARWCRKNGLSEEARFHWRTVLMYEPGNDEALRALGVRWYGDRLMTPVEINAAKRRAREARQAAKRFAPQIAKWERLLAAGDIRSRDKALDEIRTLDDPHVIAALEEVTLGQRLTTHTRFERCLQVSLAFVEALGAMPAQAATESLLRHAVFSPLKSVRTTAVEALQRRPMHDYVPPLLASLAMPIESSFRVATDNDGSVHYWHSLYREGRDADWSFEGRRSAMQIDLQGPTDVFIDDRIRGEKASFRVPAATNFALIAEMAAVASQNQQRFGSHALTAEQQIAAMNQATEATNQLILPVLAATTGQDLGENPRSWWSWWDDHNEYYSEGDTPVYERRDSDSTHRYYRPGRDANYVITPPPPPPPPGQYSCFAKGTLVWTKTGKQAIESLNIGDLVLAQNADTGELAYKPIIGRTVRPPSEIVKLSLGDEALQTTLGHPLWVAGVGWRMAKELADGAILHGVDGPVRIDAIEPAGEAEAYNLVVADFNTYFVGECGVLVHDNTARKPTTSTVPGFVAK